MAEFEREWHQVAIVVFCEAKGISYHDATTCATMALEQNLRPGTTIPVRHMAGEEEVRITESMDIGMAAGNGYLWTTPTGKASRMIASWSPPESEE